MGKVTLRPGDSAYLDTNVIIYFLEGNPQFGPSLVPLFEAIDQGHVRAVTSELTLAECLVKPFTDNDLQRRMAYESFLAQGSTLLLAPLSRSILIDAAQLRAAHHVRLPDAIHLATALQAHCRFFITNDQLIGPIPGITIVQLPDLQL